MSRTVQIHGIYHPATDRGVVPKPLTNSVQFPVKARGFRSPKLATGHEKYMRCTWTKRLRFMLLCYELVVVCNFIRYTER